VLALYDQLLRVRREARYFAGFHSGDAEDLSLLECDTVSVGRLAWSWAGHRNLWFTPLERVGGLSIWLCSSLSLQEQMFMFCPSPTPIFWDLRFLEHCS